MKSILQQDAVKCQGDYDMINIDSFLNFLDQLGYSPENKSNYREQTYYLKTIIRQTANHGQFRLNLHKTNSIIGLCLFSSHDTQLPFSLFAGIKLNNGDVLPMVSLLSVKHIESEINKIDAEKLSYKIEKETKELEKVVLDWQVERVSHSRVVKSYESLNTYKQSLMKCLSLTPVFCETKYQLFGYMISGFIYGLGTSEKGRKVKEVKYVRI